MDWQCYICKAGIHFVVSNSSCSSGNLYFHVCRYQRVNKYVEKRLWETNAEGPPPLGFGSLFWCNVSFYPLPSKNIYDIPTTSSIRRWFSITVMDRMESRERPMNGEKRAGGIMLCLYLLVGSEYGWRYYFHGCPRTIKRENSSSMIS
jgi:hypothetical protein